MVVPANMVPSETLVPELIARLPVAQLQSDADEAKAVWKKGVVDDLQEQVQRAYQGWCTPRRKTPRAFCEEHGIFAELRPRSLEDKAGWLMKSGPRASSLSDHDVVQAARCVFQDLGAAANWYVMPTAIKRSLTAKIISRSLSDNFEDVMGAAPPKWEGPLKEGHHNGVCEEFEQALLRAGLPKFNTFLHKDLWGAFCDRIANSPRIPGSPPKDNADGGRIHAALAAFTAYYAVARLRFDGFFDTLKGIAETAAIAGYEHPQFGGPDHKKNQADGRSLRDALIVNRYMLKTIKRHIQAPFDPTTSDTDPAILEILRASAADLPAMTNSVSSRRVRMDAASLSADLKRCGTSIPLISRGETTPVTMLVCHEPLRAVAERLMLLRNEMPATRTSR